VLSFAKRAVLPANVCNLVANFAGEWAITSSPLMNLIGTAMIMEIAKDTLPVFSSRSFKKFHFTLVEPFPLIPGGRRVVC